ncbi:MAG: CFI-box-CTERM domain-containing protein [Pseudomonadota bacterium]
MLHQGRRSKRTRTGKTRWHEWFYIAGRTNYKKQRWFQDPRASFNVQQFLSWGSTLRFALIDRKGYVTGKRNATFYEIQSDLDGLDVLVKTMPAAVAELYKAQRSQECRFGESGCFMTTACCKVVGLQDDCWELTQLRSLRAWVLDHSATGRTEVDEYYNLAPKIIAAIDKLPEAETIYRRLYFSYIVPCAALNFFGLRQASRRRYHRMIAEAQGVAA